MIKEEDIAFLKNLANEMNSQNNRSTSVPLYSIMDKKEVKSEDGDIVRWFNEDWEEVELGDILNDLRSDGEKIELDVDDSYAVEEFMEDNGCQKVTYTEENEHTGRVFLTLKEAEEFITSQHYHYNKPFVYVHSGNRSDELSRVLHIISQMGDNPNNNSYPWN